MALFCLFETKLVSPGMGERGRRRLSGVEASARLRRTLRAPGAHVAGQTARKPAPFLEFSVHFVGAS